ncbi:MAG: hypothetical protein R2939_10645 [Kofleriaceae bacterium]
MLGDDARGPGATTFAPAGAEPFSVALVLDDGAPIAAGVTLSSAGFIARFDAAGAPDTSFDGDGLVYRPALMAATGALNDGCLGRRADGTLLLGTWDVDAVHVTAFDAAGVLVPGFGEASSTLSLTDADLGVGDAFAPKILIDSQDRAFVVTSTLNDTRIIRITSGGVPDPAFGTAGMVTVPTILTLAADIDDQDRFLLAGFATGQRALARVLPDGQLDTTWSTDGIATAGSDEFDEVIPLPGGRAAAVSSNGVNATVNVFDATGALDPSFSDDGLLTLAPRALQLAWIGGDLIAAAGTGESFDVYRIGPDGALVDSFGGDGIASISFGPMTAFIGDVAVDDLGRLVLAGGHLFNGDYATALARMWM